MKSKLISRRQFLVAGAVGGAALATVPLGARVYAQSGQPQNVAETAMADPQFTMLVKAVIAAGLPDALKDPNATLTVFAPTDAAFAKLPKPMLDSLMNDTAKLKSVLLYHVVGAKITRKDVTAMGGKGTPKTLNGAMINVTTIGGSVYVNEAKVIKTDIPSSNGVIHAIDTVLLPPDMMASNTVAAAAMAEPMFNTLSALVTQAGLGDALKDPKATLTVFAPTDEAFAKLPKATVDALLRDKKKLQAVLLYHVLGAKVTSKDVTGMGGKGTPKTLNGAMVNVTTIDGSVYVNEAKVIKADVATGNGVIHVIDRVLLPPDMLASNTLAAAAMVTPQFNTLSMLVTQAGLGDVLKDPKSNLTVLAPNDAAFAKVPKAQIDALMADKALLKQVLLYHVLPGRIASNKLTGVVKTVNGASVNLTLIDKETYANEAKVIAKDVKTGNGVIHVIDTVLLPPDLNLSNIAAVAMVNPQFNTLSKLVTIAGLGDALKDPGASLTVFAPTDDAFKKVPAATMNMLAKNPDKLKKVLLYHVIGKKITSADVGSMGGAGKPETLAGGVVNVTTKDGTIFVNNAKVIKADVATANGVIHAIDTVLIPSDL
jgi:uncharacterized surface protein with fasciclin (FAS1) repeats